MRFDGKVCVVTGAGSGIGRAVRGYNGRVNPLGLCDLDRRVRPVGRACKKLIAEWRETLPTESNVLEICR